MLFSIQFIIFSSTCYEYPKIRRLNVEYTRIQIKTKIILTQGAANEAGNMNNIATKRGTMPVTLFWLSAKCTFKSIQITEVVKRLHFVKS